MSFINPFDFQGITMELTQEEILRVLKIIEASQYNRLHLEWDGFKLVVNKGSVSKDAFERKGLSPLTTETADIGVSEVHTKEAVEEPADLEGYIPIRAPMLGTFYRSPKPDDPPFVREGQQVESGTKVCIIEVMKLFSTIHAGVEGRIAKICAENGQLVEYDQILFLVDPQTDAGEQ